MRIVVATIQTPFIFGGAYVLINNLKINLLNCGYEVEIVSIPFKFFPETYIEDLIEIWKKQDFNNFSGYKIDRLITLQFPAYYAQHDNKVLWLIHQHRAVYDLYDPKNATDSLEKLRVKIIQNDNVEIEKYKQVYTISKNVSKRLKYYNNIASIPLYHPPQNADKFFCGESYGYIFCPSRLELLKRQDLLIKAMQYTKSNVVAIIAGTGGQLTYYEQLVKELNLSDKVGLIGFINEEEKILLYARCLAVFFAPYDEDYGYVTLEAMLSSKPVITCSDSGGPLEFVIDKETGFVMEPDPQLIAEKIDWLYENQKKAIEMGKNGFLRYKEKNINWDNVVNKLLE